jgi:hypothetical protein
MRSTCIPVAQSVVETPRVASRGGRRRRGYHQASPSQVAQGAYRRILRSRIRVRRCRSSPRCRRMRRVYPAAVTCRVIQAGHERFAAREIGPVANLAGGKTRIPWDSFRRRAVRRGRGPARNRAVMARSSETGGVRDPPGQIVPVARPALARRGTDKARMGREEVRGMAPLFIYKAECRRGGAGRAPAGYQSYEYPKEDRPQGQDCTPSPLSCSPQSPGILQTEHASPPGGKTSDPHSISPSFP